MSEEETTPAGASDTGVVRGVPGPVIKDVGLLDLRGASDEDLARLERIEDVGAILISPGSAGKLKNVALSDVGATIEATEKDQLITTPLLDFDQATLTAMPDGQRLIITGIVAFADDIDPTLVAQKF